MTAEYGPDRWVFAVVIIASTIGFGLVFVLSWILSKRWWPTIFPKLQKFDQADWCSRVGSTLHSFIIVPGFIVTMSLTDWIDYWPVDEGQAAVSATRILMCLSMGYFAFDFWVIVYYRVPLWYVFVVHHLVASLPFYIHLFMLECRGATFVLEGFLLVELANIFMNTLSWLDKAGAVKTKLYTVVFYINYIVWIPARLAIPVMMTAIIYKFIYFHEKAESMRGCLVPGMVCCHIIGVFCWAVFIVFLSPDMVRRWQKPEEEAKKTEEIEKQREVSGISRPASSRNEPIEEGHADSEEMQREQSAERKRSSVHSSRASTPRRVVEYVAETLREMADPEKEQSRTPTERGETTLHRANSLHPF